jgi:hypothetical protein
MRATALATTFCLAVPRLAAGIQPKPQGHMLTPTELGNITSIDCLQAKQSNPAIECKEDGNHFLGGVVHATENLNAGNFPKYNDAVCNSGGEFFCDPEGRLTSQERAQIAGNLTTLRQSVGVTCGRLQGDPVDPHHLQTFYLGVVILPSNWPSSESGPEALQTFGQIVAADWNMDNKWVGTPQPYLRCPTSAVLVVQPTKRQAFLSSASCEFICSSRGGPEVVTATLVNLDKKGTAAGLLAGIQEVYNVLGASVPAFESVPTAPSSPASGDGNATASGSASGSSNDVFWAFSSGFQRFLMVLSVLAFVASLALGVVVMLLAPGLLAPRRK